MWVQHSTCLLVTLLAFFVPRAILANEGRTGVQVTAHDFLVAQEDVKTFIARSQVFNVCCVQGGVRDTLPSQKHAGLRLFVDPYTLHLSQQLFVPFKERFGIWETRYTYSIWFGLTLSAETRYIAQPRIGFFVPTQSEPIIALNIARPDAFLEVRVDFFDTPLIE